MIPLRSRIDFRSEAFASNTEANLAGIATLHQHLDKARAGGGPKYVQRHLDRGKLLPRQRIDELLDRGSPFLELCSLAGLNQQVEQSGINQELAKHRAAQQPSLAGTLPW